jgi:hypothetical protein
MELRVTTLWNQKCSFLASCCWKSSKIDCFEELVLNICYCFVFSRRSGSGRVGLGPVLVLRRARRTLIIVILLLFLLSSLLLLSCFSPAFTIHIFLPRRQLCSNATTAATNNTQ